MADLSALNVSPGSYIWNQPGKLSPFAMGQTEGIGNGSVGTASRNDALRQGPSAWRQLLQKGISSNQQAGLNNAASNSESAAASARSNLAMHGGLSSGARERIARDSSNNYLNMAQDVSNQANNAGYQADATDEGNRIKALQGQNASDNQLGLAKANLNIGAQQYDTNNDINSYDKLNYANLEKYKTNMSTWAAGKQADATANSGKK